MTTEPLIVNECLDTPILLIVFRRPEITKKVFDEIRKVKPKRLFIAQDGPRGNNKEEALKVQEVRTIFNEIDWDCEVKTLYREENLGCKYNILYAINWFFENVDEGIVLEDDILPTQSFFWFCQQMLNKYRTDSRIMHISGYELCNYPDELETSTYFFTQFINPWGWATWKRAWVLNNPEMINIEKFIDQKQIKNIFHHKFVQLYYQDLFLHAHRDKAIAWDYQWIYSVLTNHGLVIRPFKSLVENLGFGTEGATNTATKLNFEQKKYEIPEIIHPDFVLPISYEEEKRLARINRKYFLKTLPRRIRKWMLSFRLSKEGRFLKIFGVYIIKPTYD